MIIQIVIATTHVHITFLSHCAYFGRYACWIAIRVTERSELPIRWVWFLYFSYTPKLRFSESRFSEILGLVNKSQLP